MSLTEFSGRRRGVPTIMTRRVGLLGPLSSVNHNPPRIVITIMQEMITSPRYTLPVPGLKVIPEDHKMLALNALRKSDDLSVINSMIDHAGIKITGGFTD